MRASVDPGDHRHPPGGVEVVEVRKDFLSMDGALFFTGGVDSTRCCQSAISQWDWGFHTVRSVVDSGELVFCHHTVGFVEIWRDIGTGDGALSFLGEAEPRG